MTPTQHDPTPIVIAIAWAVMTVVLAIKVAWFL